MTAAELSAAVDQVTPQAVADLAFFAGTRGQFCASLADYAAAGLHLHDYHGHIRHIRLARSINGRSAR